MVKGLVIILGGSEPLLCVMEGLKFTVSADVGSQKNIKPCMVKVKSHITPIFTFFTWMPCCERESHKRMCLIGLNKVLFTENTQ